MTLALYGGPSAKLTLVLPIQSVRNPTRTVLALGIHRRSEQEMVGTLGIPSALAQQHSQKFIWQAREKIGSYLVGPGFSDQLVGFAGNALRTSLGLVGVHLVLC